jgi:hypothetical protein
MEHDITLINSLRGTWQFTYPVSELAKAAQKLKKYHEDRLAWWESEAEQAEAELKDKGFEYRESRFTGGHDVTIVGDPQLSKRVQECKAKISGHKARIYDYGTWDRVFQLNLNQDEKAELPLKFEDVVFFGL